MEFSKFPSVIDFSFHSIIAREHTCIILTLNFGNYFMSMLENNSCCLEECVFILVIWGGGFYGYLLVYTVAYVFYFLLIYLVVLSFIESGIFILPTITIELYMSPFNSATFCFMYFGALLTDKCVFIIVIPF